MQRNGMRFGATGVDDETSTMGRQRQQLAAMTAQQPHKYTRTPLMTLTQ